jgi:hypothetical protein
VTDSDDARAFIDQWAAIARRMVANSGAVIADTAQRIGAGTFTSQDWVKSTTQMFDIALLGTLEVVETAVVGPARSSPHQIRSDQIAIDVDANGERILMIDTPFRRLGDIAAIPPERITFDPPAGCDSDRNPLGVIAAGARTFYIVVNSDGLPSGIYSGAVRVALPQDVDGVRIPVTLAL